MVTRKVQPKKFFGREERSRIVDAIRKAEEKTSGEIRVYLERKSKGNSLGRAEKIFQKLGMNRTRCRNGILFYFCLVRRSFAVVGDQGIHERGGSEFWTAVAGRMQDEFVQGRFADGLEAGIRQAGDELAKYFPREKGDVNELSDEIRGDFS